LSPIIRKMPRVQATLYRVGTDYCPDHSILCDTDLLLNSPGLEVMELSVRDETDVAPVEVSSPEHVRDFLKAFTEEDDDLNRIAITFDNDEDMATFHDGLKPRLRREVQGYPLWTSLTPDSKIRPVSRESYSRLSDNELEYRLDTKRGKELARVLDYIARHRPDLTDRAALWVIGNAGIGEGFELLPNHVILTFLPPLLTSSGHNNLERIGDVLEALKFEDRGALRRAVSMIMDHLRDSRKEKGIQRIQRRMERAKRQVINRLMAEHIQAQAQERVKKHALDLDDKEHQRKRSRRASDPHIQKCEQWSARCAYSPLDLEDWCEHDDRLYYSLNGFEKCFDAEELARHFDSQLTAENNGNPYPQHPSDPWNKVPLTFEELVSFAHFCEEEAGLNLNELTPTFARFLAFMVTGDAPGHIGRPFQQKFMERVIDAVVAANPSV
jgi:hypothetical protein